MDPDGREVYLYARKLDTKGGGVGVHTFLKIVPDKPSDFAVQHEFSFTIGGYQITKDGPLVGEIDRPVDVNWSYNKFKEGAPVLINTPEGKTDTKFIWDLLEVYGRRDTSQSYDALSRKGKGYNCNNFSAALIEGAGGNLPDKGKDFWWANPGLGETIPRMMDPKTNNSKNWVPEFVNKVLVPEINRDRQKTVWGIFRGNNKNADIKK